MADINPTAELIKALIKFQSAVPEIAKSSTAKVPTKSGGEFSYSYAKLEHIQDIIKKPLADAKLAVSQQPSHINGEPALRTMLMHESGGMIEDITPLILPKNDPQGMGSAITYARRYGLGSVLGLVIDDDDDARSATHSVSQQGSYKASDNKPASPKQKQFINKLYLDAGGEDGMQKAFIEGEGINSETMTSAEASTLIERLQQGEL